MRASGRAPSPLLRSVFRLPGLLLCSVALMLPAAAQALATAHEPAAAMPSPAIPPGQASPGHRARGARHPARPRPQVAEAGPAYGRRADLMAFAAELAERRGLPLEVLAMPLTQARRIEAARRLIMPAPAGVAKNWAAYRERFVEPQRIGAGLVFWHANAAWLDLAERRWGVPPAIIVGLIGVETFYGRLNGRFRTLDVLATLAFDFPPGRSDRSAFFRGELEEFLVLCAREGIDPRRPLGSFAGAIGLPQFMPGSINRHAVDLDGDGRVDLVASAADAIGSVAHYLAEAGWQRGEPTHFVVQPPDDAAARAQLLEPDVLPAFSAEQMDVLGASLDEAGRAHAGPLALIELDNGAGEPSYVAGTQNFYAITRYNRSSYYAMAVISLAEALQAARARPAADGEQVSAGR